MSSGQCNCVEPGGGCDWCYLEAKNEQLEAEVERLRQGLEGLCQCRGHDPEVGLPQCEACMILEGGARR